jgi:hypothetical protein
LSRVETEVYWHERNARQTRQQRRDDDFYEWLQLLLKEMQTYEALHDWAIRHHESELQSLTEELITITGGDYILLKVGRYETK